MVESIFAVLAAGLSIWSSKEKTKYIDKLIKLKRDYYEEINKPFERRDNARIDNLEFELRILGDSFAASVAKSDA